MSTSVSDEDDETESSNSSVSESVKHMRIFIRKAQGCRVVPGYSRNPRFIKMRPALIAYATKYTYRVDKPTVPVTAITIGYADLFLSQKKRIPVVILHEGVQIHFQIFVLACAVLACADNDIFTTEFRESHFLAEHQFTAHIYIYMMRDEIRKVISKIGVVVNPWDGLPDIYTLMTDNVETSISRLDAWETLLAIRRDIKFTEYKHSTLVVAAILVTSYRTKPELYSTLLENLLTSYPYYFDKSEVIECFEEMKSHDIVEEVFFSHLPRAKRVFPTIGKNKGKTVQMIDFSINDVCEQFVQQFDPDWLEPS